MGYASSHLPTDAAPVLQAGPAHAQLFYPRNMADDVPAARMSTPDFPATLFLKNKWNTTSNQYYLYPDYTPTANQPMLAHQSASPFNIYTFTNPVGTKILLIDVHIANPAATRNWHDNTEAQHNEDNPVYCAFLATSLAAMDLVTTASASGVDSSDYWHRGFAPNLGTGVATVYRIWNKLTVPIVFQNRVKELPGGAAIGPTYINAFAAGSFAANTAIAPYSGQTAGNYTTNHLYFDLINDTGTAPTGGVAGVDYPSGTTFQGNLMIGQNVDLYIGTDEFVTFQYQSPSSGNSNITSTAGWYEVDSMNIQVPPAV